MARQSFFIIESNHSIIFKMKKNRNPLRTFAFCIFLYSASIGAFEAVIPDLPTLSSPHYFLMDYHTGAIIAEREADEKVSSASITKLMTAYIVYQAIKEGIINLSDKVKISNEAYKAEGSRMFLELGSEVTLNELLQGLVVQSGNDASVAVAEQVAGEEGYFLAMMNAQAEKLGMKDSHFMNVSGFSEDGHYMSARDISTLARALIHDFPEQYKRYSQKQYTYNDISQHNRNRLLWRDSSVDGLKTGFTEDAGYCLVASAKRDGMRLISVVLGATSDKHRFNDTERLFNYGFRFYKTHRLYSSGESLHQMRVWGGESQQLNLGVEQDFYVTIPRHGRSKLQVEKDILSDLSAPVELNQSIGTITVSSTDRFSQVAPLVALESVSQGSLWIRLKDEFIQLFN